MAKEKKMETEKMVISNSPAGAGASGSVLAAQQQLANLLRCETDTNRNKDRKKCKKEKTTSNLIKCKLKYR